LGGHVDIQYTKHIRILHSLLPVNEIFFLVCSDQTRIRMKQSNMIVVLCIMLTINLVVAMTDLRSTAEVGAEAWEANNL